MAEPACGIIFVLLPSSPLMPPRDVDADGFGSARFFIRCPPEREPDECLLQIAVCGWSPSRPE